MLRQAKFAQSQPKDVYLRKMVIMETRCHKRFQDMLLVHRTNRTRRIMQPNRWKRKFPKCTEVQTLKRGQTPLNLEQQNER